MVAKALLMSVSSLPIRALAVAGGVFALTACNPETPYRYTALTPAARPIPWDGRAAPAGQLRIEGAISKGTIFQKELPQIHDTALNVPGVTAEGSISIAPIKGFEMGIRGAYSAYAWSQPSIDGTEPLPSHPAVWGVGPEFKGTIVIDKRRRFAIGLAGNVMRYETPYAEWQLTGPNTADGQSVPCAPSPTCTVDPATLNDSHYSLFAEKSESHITASFGVYPSFDFTGTGAYGHLFAILAGHTGFENDGFTDKAQNGSTLTGYLFIPIVGAGYGIDVDPVRASVMIYEPITTYASPVYYGPAVMASLGFDIDLWHSKEDDTPRGEHSSAPDAKAPPPPTANTPPPQTREPQIIVAPAPPDDTADNQEKPTDQPGVFTAH